MANKDFYCKKELIKIYLYAGIVTFMISIFFFLFGGEIGYIIFSVICFNIYFFKKGKPLVSMHEEGFYMKSSLFATLMTYKYSELVSIERKSEKKVLLHYVYNNNKRQVLLPIGMLVESDQTDLVNILEEKITNNKK